MNAPQTALPSGAETASSLSPADALRLLRAIDYDWTMLLRGVWTDPPYDSPEIHTAQRDEFREALVQLKAAPKGDSPPGWLLAGLAGSGKTHFLSLCRRQAVAQGVSFVLVDMTDIRDFWSTVLQGYLDSLQQEYTPGKFQQQVLLERFLDTVLKTPAAEAIEKLGRYPQNQLANNVTRVIEFIAQRHPRETRLYHDVIRALLAMTSRHYDVSAAGFNWLNANAVDEAMRSLLGFTKPQESPQQIVRALSWMMSLCGPTVVAFDQLDPIVAQLDPKAQAEGRDPDSQGLQALAIIREIASGLGAMRDVTFRTLTVVACLEVTLDVLHQHTLQSWRDRFEVEPRLLPALAGSAAAGLLAPRVLAAGEKTGVHPPHAAWPVAPAAITAAAGLTPRELLKHCEAHRSQCLRANSPAELTSFAASQPVQQQPPQPADLWRTLDQAFAEHAAAADIKWLLEQACDDDRLAPLLIAGCRALLREADLPAAVDGVVDEFPGGQTTRPLHARVRLIAHNQGDRETHFCYRALQRTNASAFQARLKGVLNGSGIDARFGFRHGVILRSQPLPGGKVTEQLLAEFAKNGGRWHTPSEGELRTLFALERLGKENPPEFAGWLRARRPASQLPLFGEFTHHQGAQPAAAPNQPSPTTAAAQPVAVPVAQPAAQPTPQPESMPAVQPTPPVRKQVAADASILLGVRQVGVKPEAVRLPLPLLAKHAVVLAGAGSGKTVLLKHLVEEAALAGVPSIVIDCANDLAALGQPRSAAPADFSAERWALAERCQQETEVVVYTPGRESGNPLIFEPLPDLAAVAGDPDELQSAVEMVLESIGPVIASGRSAAANNKRALFSKALRFFATQGGGDLEGLIGLCQNAPPEAGLGLPNEERIFRELASGLLSAREINPVLRGAGAGIDPAVLFGDKQATAGKTRISVINLVGLPALETQQMFVNQLAMTLFGWIKRHPQPPGRPLRGLLVLDEAKDFVPSRGVTPCKASLQRLAAQARKYALGVIFATQNPREIENTIIGNCSSQFYGKASSPAAQDTIQAQLRQRGGSGDDIGRLQRGQFYFHNADLGMSQPAKLHTPLCLSDHQTLEQADILRLASASRARLGERSLARPEHNHEA